MANGTGPDRDPFGASDDLRFGELREHGIALAQQLAADSWTDYNLHDPGVTLLEQLCYALTDLIHRADFDVADHLTSTDGKIDYESLGLALPEEIFPSRPTTGTDYRRVILDRVPYVNDARIRPVFDGGAGGAPPSGLYRILLRPHPKATESDLAAIRSAVETVYMRYRNLCEDLEEIAFVREIDCEIVADVEVELGRKSDEILAEIYQRCAEHIAARVRIHPFEEARWAGRSLGDVFTGPLGLHGICDEADLQRGQEAHPVSEFFSIINRIEGVDYVRDLYFLVAGQEQRDAISTDSPEDALRLHIPCAPDQIRIQLSSNGRRLPLPFEAFKSAFRAWSLAASGAKRTRQDARKLYTVPVGEYRDLSRYTSIQTQFPSNYRVGTRRLSESAPVSIRARSRQLKGYLILFDQLMANYTANVESLKQLYSRDLEPRRTYASQVLDKSQIAELDDIYPRDPHAEIAKVVGRYDNFADRKGRLLDYLLALYCEGFSQHSLRAFNFYGSAEEREHALTENKAKFLRAVVALGRDRGAAADYSSQNGDAVSGLQHRVSYLLGLTEHRRKSLTAAFTDHGLRPAAGDQGGATERHAVEPKPCDIGEFRLPENPWEDEVPLDPSGAGQSLSQLMEQVGKLLPRRDGQVEPGVLSSGVFLSSYRLGHSNEDTSWHAYLVSGDEDRARWWRIGPFANRGEGIEAVNKLRRLVVELNTESEGMHVVEHILLRPRKQAPPASGESQVASDFISFRLSVLFPAWTARFRDRGFRALAVETIRLNCPAHTVPEVHWLEFADMLEFERLHGDWSLSLAGGSAAAEAVDAASAPLREFLSARKGEVCWAMAPSDGHGNDSSE